MTRNAYKQLAKWWQVAVMSFLAALLAGSIQTVWVLTHSIPSRYYQAIFYPHREVIDLAVSIPIVVVLEALITFFLVLALMRIRPWLQWPAFLLCWALWIYVAFISIAPVS